MSDNIKILKNYLLYFLTFILTCLIGLTGVFADTTINMSSWTNSTGRKWSSNLYDTSSDIVSDTYSVRAYYNVSAPIYTPPDSYDYVDFLYFQNSSGSNFNPCNGDDFRTNFYLQFSTPSFVNYVSRVRFSYHSDTGYDSCLISSRNASTGRLDVSCSTEYVNDSGALVIWVDFNRNIPDTQSSWLYIQKNIPLSCMTNNQAIINNQNQNTQNIINNNNQNTQDIINNNNTNTNNIINNQNQNTQQEIESQKVCKYYSSENSIAIDNKYLNLSGSETTSSSGNGAISNYIDISSSDFDITYTPVSGNTNLNSCFYTSSKSLISCFLANNDLPTIPNNAYYIRLSFYKPNNKPVLKICSNGNQVLNDSITGLNDSLNDDDSSGATSEASDFFSSFNTNTFGLTSIITAPLNLIQSVLSSTCTDLQLPLPYLANKYLTLPCMSSIYSQHFGTFFTIYQTITYGIIAYWVCVRIFNQVKDFKNPEHDEIEVMDL